MDVNWNEEKRKPSWKQYKYGDIDFDISVKYTLDELKNVIEEEYAHMSEEERHFRYGVGCSPTFLETVYTSVSDKLLENQLVEIDERCHMYRIINKF